MQLTILFLHFSYKKQAWREVVVDCQRSIRRTFWRQNLWGYPSFAAPDLLMKLNKSEGGQLRETQNCLGRFLFKWYLMLVFHLFQLYCQFRKRRSCIRVFQPAQFHYFVPVTTQTLCMVCWETILSVHTNSSFASYLKPLHLVSFWKREFLDLGSGLLE